LQEVFRVHALGDGTISSELENTDLNDLEAFLKTIDDRTQPFGSDTDEFLEDIGG